MVNRQKLDEYWSSNPRQTKTKLTQQKNIPHKQTKSDILWENRRFGNWCIVPSTCRDLLLQLSAPNHHMHHHFGLIVFLSVCGEATCCAGMVRASSLFFLPYAWTVLQLCVGRAPPPPCEAVKLAHGGVNNTSVASLYADKVLPHYLGDLLTRIPSLWGVRNGCDFWPTVWCFCLQHQDRWYSDVTAVY